MTKSIGPRWESRRGSTDRATGVRYPDRIVEVVHDDERNDSLTVQDLHTLLIRRVSRASFVRNYRKLE